MVELLTERGLILKKGTIVDSTIISAPSSTKNANRQRDPEAHQVKKGNMWYFGYKAHAGVDETSGLVHTLKVTPANQHDVTMTAELMHGDEGKAAWRQRLSWCGKARECDFEKPFRQENQVYN